MINQGIQIGESDVKDMEEARKRATAWIVFSAVYAMMAAIAVVLGFFWAEAFVPLVSMICAAACFELGRDYQVEMARERREVSGREGKRGGGGMTPPASVPV